MKRKLETEENLHNIKIPRYEIFFEEEILDLVTIKERSPKEIIANRIRILKILNKENFNSLSFNTKISLFNFFVNDDRNFVEHFIDHEKDLLSKATVFFVDQHCEGDRDLNALSPLCRHIKRGQTPAAYLKIDEIDSREKQKLIELPTEIQEDALQIFVENCVFLNTLFKNKNLSLKNKIESILIYSCYLTETPDQLEVLNQTINNLFLQKDWTRDENITAENIEKINAVILNAWFIVEAGKEARKEQIKILLEYNRVQFGNSFHIGFLNNRIDSPDLDLFAYSIECGDLYSSNHDVIVLFTKIFPAKTLLSSDFFQKFLMNFVEDINEKNIKATELASETSYDDSDEDDSDEDDSDLDDSDDDCEYKQILTKLAPDKAPLNFLDDESNEQIISLLENRINEWKEDCFHEPLSRILIKYAILKVPHFNWVVPFLKKRPDLESEIICFLPLTRFLSSPAYFANQVKIFPLFKKLYDFHEIGIKRNKFYFPDPYKTKPIVETTIIKYIENSYLKLTKSGYYRDRILNLLNKNEFKRLPSECRSDIMELFMRKDQPSDNSNTYNSIDQLKTLLQYLFLSFRSQYNPFTRIKKWEHIDLNKLSLITEQLFPSNTQWYKYTPNVYHPLLSLPYIWSREKRKPGLDMFYQLGLYNCLTEENYNSTNMRHLLEYIEETYKEYFYLNFYEKPEDIALRIANNLKVYQDAIMPMKSIKKIAIQKEIYQATDFNWLKPLLVNNSELESVLLPFLRKGININQEVFIYLLDFPNFYELLDPFNAVLNRFSSYQEAFSQFITCKIEEICASKEIGSHKKQLAFLIIKDLIRSSMLFQKSIFQILEKTLHLTNDELRNELLNLAYIYKKDNISRYISEFERESVLNPSQENQGGPDSSSNSGESFPVSYGQTLKSTFFAPVSTTQEFLHHVTRRNKIEVQKMLAANTDLIYQKGQITTLEGRIFYNVSAFQYALWAPDIDMWEKMLKWITRNEEIDSKLYEQIEEMDQKGVNYKFKGKIICEKHYNFSALLAILDKIHEEDREIGCNYRLLGTVQKEFPLALIHFLATHNYKSDEQIDAFYNHNINQQEKWCDSKYLGELFCLRGGRRLDTISKVPIESDERKLRELKDIFEYKFAKLKLKLSKEDCLMRESSFDNTM